MSSAVVTGAVVAMTPIDRIAATNRWRDHALAEKALLDAKDADLDRYVTQKTMDGLFLMIAEQEKAIRKDPVGTGSALLQRVFGGK